MDTSGNRPLLLSSSVQLLVLNVIKMSEEGRTVMVFEVSNISGSVAAMHCCFSAIFGSRKSGCDLRAGFQMI